MAKKATNIKRKAVHKYKLQIKKTKAHTDRQHVKVKTKGQSIKTMQKSSSAKNSAVKRNVETTKQPNFLDFEDVLISSILKDNQSKVNRNTLLIPEFLHNITPTTRRLTYNAGYSIGRELYAKSPSHAIDPLMKMFESAGLGNILYYPFNDSAVFTIKKHEEGVGIGAKLHNYEAGIIAGYLTASTGIATAVKETKCVYNGDDSCQFVAVPKNSAGESEDAVLSFDRTLSELQKIFGSNSNGLVSEDYYMMNMLPFIKQGISSSVSKLMYVIGKRFAESKRKLKLEEVASYLGISASMTETSKNIIVKLDYNSRNSSEGFVNISSSMLLGYIKSAYNKEPTIVRGTKAGAYEVKFEIPKN